MNRAPIMVALYERAAAAIGFKTAGRILRHFGQTTSQPALFLRYHGETLIRNPSGLRGPRHLRVGLMVYVNGEDRFDKDSELSLYDSLAAIETALAASPLTNTQTLGGLVIDCWIDNIDPGFYPDGKQAVALLDVLMLIAN